MPGLQATERALPWLHPGRSLRDASDIPRTLRKSQGWNSKFGRGEKLAFGYPKLNGRDQRGDPLEARKDALAALLAARGMAWALVEHVEEDGRASVMRAFLGVEGVVSKRIVNLISMPFSISFVITGLIKRPETKELRRI